MKPNEFNAAVELLNMAAIRKTVEGIDSARLEAICNAERDNRCVVLPCWGTVYIISGGQIQEMSMCHYRGHGGGIYDMRCECADQHEDCDTFCHNENDKACAYNFRVAEIGKTVFLTREEAEHAAADYQAMYGAWHEQK